MTEETTQRLQRLVAGVKERYDAFAFCDGYRLVLEELKAVGARCAGDSQMNLFFNEHPWTLAKDPKDPKDTQHLCSVL